MNQAVQKLIDVIDALLGPDGCPWDKEQTPTTLCDYVLEEAYELVDAIRSDNAVETCEELGDVMFLLFFIARRYKDMGEFELADSLDYAANKMIRRHPHVFGDLKLANQEELLRNWERIKRNEKNGGDENGDGEDAAPARVYGSLPKGLPPMLKAYRIHSKAARAGFTWSETEEVEKQLASEWQEFQDAVASGDSERMEEEYGDYLFTLIELGRRHGFKANASLDRANLKFLDRFHRMESIIRDQGKDVAALPLDELNALWDKVKAE